MISDTAQLAAQLKPVGEARSATCSSTSSATTASSASLDYIFFQAAAVNGFDSFGHYLRAGPDRQPVHDLRGRADRRLLGELPRGHGVQPRAPAAAAAPRDPVLEWTQRFFDGEDVEPVRSRPGEDDEPRADRDGGGQGERRRGRRRRARHRRRRRRARAGARGDPDARADPGGDAHARAGRHPGARRHARAADPSPTPPAGASSGNDRRPSRCSTTCSGSGGLMAPGAGGNIAGNPVLIGAATVLVILVAVFLSYNANQGLPFVPVLQAQGGDAERGEPRARQRGADRRRRASAPSTRSASSAATTARASRVLGLKLERSVDPLPNDSTVLIRPRSALGLKYVELTRGTSDEGFEDGDTIPLAQRHARRPSSSTSS